MMELSSWFSPSFIKRVGFDDVLFAAQNPNVYLLINTLPTTEQQCLVQHTLSIAEEESTLNRLLSTETHYTKPVIVYGRNCADATVDRKYQQLSALGFREVHVYAGGMLEWLLLQDVYGQDEFPTTSIITDLLLFRPTKRHSS
jgi:hypothetical protein